MDRKTIVTAGGRRLTVTATPDQYGRVVYQVAKVGAFTIEPDERSYWHEDKGRSLHLWYGRMEGAPRWVRGAELPDKPVVCTVDLEGGAVFRPDSMDPARHWGWLVVHRTGGGSAPDATARRVADIVHALVTDWLARDDLDDLRGYHDWHHARSRRADHARNIERLNAQVATLLQELAGEYHGYAEQSAILGEAGAASPPQFPDPATRDGQAILRLREQLATLQKEEGGDLPGGDVVPLLEAWLEDMNIALPK